MSIRTSAISKDPVIQPPAVIRWLDIILLIASLPVALMITPYKLGVIVAAVAWVVQRALASLVLKRSSGTDSIRESMGYQVAGTLVRAWLVMLTLIAVVVFAGKPQAAAGCITTLAVFSVQFLMTLFFRPRVVISKENEA